MCLYAGWATGSKAVHAWLRNHYPKSGRCDKCGAEGRTEFAYLHHPLPPSRDRNDYRELCRKCHVAQDGFWGRDRVALNRPATWDAIHPQKGWTQ